MLQNTCKVIGYKKNMVYKIAGGGGGGGGLRDEGGGGEGCRLTIAGQRPTKP